VQADVGDVCHSKLIDASQLRAARQVEIDLQLVVRVRGNHKRVARLMREDNLLAIQPKAFVGYRRN
jgi:hypothetical protein